MKLAKYLLLSLIAVLSFTNLTAQEDDPILLYSPASQNLLKFNRFLINPTFSTVQEDKSYINLLHRNQSVQFKDNDQTYFLSYSGRIGDKSGLGLSLYTQSIGPVSNIGVLANYAYGIKLSDKSNFTFGGNLAYYSTGLDRNNVDVIDTDDFRLNGTEDSNVLSFQPGFNLSYGKIDFGVFAENLFDYNLKTSESLTDFADKTYSAHLQYTHPFENSNGIMEGSRLMPIARVRINGQNRFASDENADDISFGGGVILDLPKLGWLQGGYDSFFGASAGAGFNINKRLSLGYTMEKGFSTDFDNLGVTHEISFAYSFTPNLTEDRVMLEDDFEDDLAEEKEFNKDDLASNEEIAELKRKLAENDAIIEELMFRQDSLENSRQKDLERRFNMVMSMVRNETSGQRPDLEDRAEAMFLGQQTRPSVAQYNASNDGNIPNSTSQKVKENERHVAQNANQQQVRDKIPTKKAVVAANNPSKTNAVKSRKFKNLDNVNDGYYVVANVYKGGKYMDNFLNDMTNQGFESTNYIDNPKNGLKYVYLERYDTWEEAVAAHNSGLNGSYDGPLWIMNVDNSYSNEAYAANVDKIKEKSAKYDDDVLQQNVVVKDQVASKELTSKTYKIDGIGSGYYIIATYSQALKMPIGL